MVPLYGDMQIAPFNYVMRTKNYDASKWPACNSHSESIQGKILEQVDRIRQEHTNFISELAKYSNQVSCELLLNQLNAASNNTLTTDSAKPDIV